MESAKAPAPPRVGRGLRVCFPDGLSAWGRLESNPARPQVTSLLWSFVSSLIQRGDHLASGCSERCSGSRVKCQAALGAPASAQGGLVRLGEETWDLNARDLYGVCAFLKLHRLDPICILEIPRME